MFPLHLKENFRSNDFFSPGPGLSIATAGAVSMLRIQQRDVFSNLRDAGGDPFVVARLDQVRFRAKSNA